jgi:pimeloyl-ACP methyl ester carboxylesterase
MPREKAKPSTHPPSRGFEQRQGSLRSHTTPPVVSGRWLLAAVSITLAAAAVCAWCTLCLLFWQGGWQLLYHPELTLARTPASIGLAFDPVGFASTEAGEPLLKGWWISASQNNQTARFSRYTVLYLHGQNGNLANALNALDTLHTTGVNVLAFDYRSYGQSQFARPSETHWRQDAEWALRYLTGTRHVAPGSIVVDGDNLGANLALEIAADHPELGGVVLRQPLDTPVNAIFSDPRARLVPARLLVRDRFDLNAAAARLRIPSLWFIETPAQVQARMPMNPDAFQRVTAPKMLVELANLPSAENDSELALSRWLDDLPNPGTTSPN